MLKILNEKNNVEIYSVFDEEFKDYGEIIGDIDVAEISKVALTTEMPKDGAKYLPSDEKLEKLSVCADLKEKFFGELPAQVGYCYGFNTKLNATEWHTSSEINIAVTDVVLLIAKRSEIVNGKIDSSSFKAFFVPKGTVIETYATTLHFTPCQSSDNGFGWVVILPLGTNTPLDKKADNNLLWAKNKWILSHIDNKPLLERGAFGGITGENIEINY